MYGENTFFIYKANAISYMYHYFPLYIKIMYIDEIVFTSNIKVVLSVDKIIFFGQSFNCTGVREKTSQFFQVSVKETCSKTVHDVNNMYAISTMKAILSGVKNCKDNLCLRIISIFVLEVNFMGVKNQWWCLKDSPVVVYSKFLAFFVLSSLIASKTKAVIITMK